MSRLRRFIGLALALTGSAWLAASASAAPVRPALSTLPFVQISDAAALAARFSPVCPNGLVCYSPALLQQAYDFPAGAGAPTGAGQTIVVVDPYGSPTIATDLAQFDAENGLPAPPSFTIAAQQTQVSTEGSGDLFTWSVETSLDVEYAHAMAPGARIVLAVAATDVSTNIAELEREILPAYPGAIVTQSFGEDDSGDNSDPDFSATLEPLYAAATASGGTIVASSGDFGGSNLTSLTPSPTPMASYPASSPYVLAVGGTEGKSSAGGLWHLPGKYGGEQVWNEITPSGFAGASGGAPSSVFAAPPWQAGVTGTSMRAEPDVSYNAAVDGGAIIVLGGRHGVVGGTSAGAPQWAAIVALANELRGLQAKPPLGLVATSLYAIARDTRLYQHDFHDIVIGDNALAGVLPGFSAGPGYDLATGLGSPDVSPLLSQLAAASRPAVLSAGLTHPRGGGGRHVRLVPGG